MQANARRLLAAGRHRLYQHQQRAEARTRRRPRRARRSSASLARRRRSTTSCGATRLGMALGAVAGTTAHGRLVGPAGADSRRAAARPALPDPRAARVGDGQPAAAPHARRGDRRRAGPRARRRPQRRGAVAPDGARRPRAGAHARGAALPVEAPRVALHFYRPHGSTKWLPSTRGATTRRGRRRPSPARDATAPTPSAAPPRRGAVARLERLTHKKRSQFRFRPQSISKRRGQHLPVT